jgi:glucan biosynthesis protein C
MAAKPRLLFIDNLRWSMILLVISMHAADTYSPLGSWYYTDRVPISQATLLAFALWQTFLQAFFMGLLFFTAGFFTPASFERKGPAAFLRDRAFRLGLPVLFFMFVLGPITEYFCAHSWTSTRPTSFANEWIKHIRNGEFLQENGPLWFCLALLIFSVVYAVSPPGRTAKTNPTGNGQLMVFVFIMSVLTALVRAAHPPSFLNMHLSDFPQYIMLFAAGTLAARGEWITKLPLRSGIRWLTAALTIGLAAWFFIALEGKGTAWRTTAFACWESFTCVAVSYGLIVIFREKFNNQNRAAKYLSDNAFSVYVFHPPIVILIARAMHPLTWHPLLKFAMLTVLAVVASFALSGALFRRIPYLRAIL